MIIESFTGIDACQYRIWKGGSGSYGKKKQPKHIGYLQLFNWIFWFKNETLFVRFFTSSIICSHNFKWGANNEIKATKVHDCQKRTFSFLNTFFYSMTKNRRRWWRWMGRKHLFLFFIGEHQTKSCEMSKENSKVWKRKSYKKSLQ